MGNDTISATAFKLIDEQGNERAAFSLVDGLPSLTLRDGMGRVRALLEVRDSGPSFLIADENGEARIGVDYAEGGSSLFVRDAMGHLRIGLDENAGGATISVSGSEANTCIEIVASEAGDPKLGFFRRDGTPALIIELVETMPTLSLVNPDRTSAIHLAGGDNASIWVQRGERGLVPVP